MNAECPVSPRDRRYAVWIGVTATVFVAAVAAGFVWLPAVQGVRSVPDLWSVICTAIGLPSQDAPTGRSGASRPASEVAWTVDTRQLLAGGVAARGAALAAGSCVNCHGRAGISDDAIFPNLAGQSAESIYKQLQDFRSGMREPAVMGVYVASLGDNDIRDLAAHYASLAVPAGRSTPGAAPAAPEAAAATRRLVEFGDPMRGIPACAACHGPSGFTAAAPTLAGQQRAYLEVQLQALASGRRRNDINAQMRSVARRLTAPEISALSAYYSDAQPGAAAQRPTPR